MIGRIEDVAPPGGGADAWRSEWANTVGMAKRYSIAEARKNFAKLVHEAEGGAGVELTRRGRPVAVLIAIREYERLRRDRPTFSEAFAGFVEQHGDDAVGLDTEVVSGLRDRSTGRRVD